MCFNPWGMSPDVLVFVVSVRNRTGADEAKPSAQIRSWLYLWSGVADARRKRSSREAKNKDIDDYLANKSSTHRVLFVLLPPPPQPHTGLASSSSSSLQSPDIQEQLGRLSEELETRFRLKVPLKQSEGSAKALYKSLASCQTGHGSRRFVECEASRKLDELNFLVSRRCLLLRPD